MKPCIWMKDPIIYECSIIYKLQLTIYILVNLKNF